MADVIRALTEAVDKIGLLAVLIISIIVAAIYIVTWNRRLVDSMSNLGKETIQRNTISMNDNTASNLKLVAAVDKLCAAFDSDSIKKTKEEIIEAVSKRFNCRAEEASILIKEHERRKSKEHDIKPIQ